jgi:hypothetical protein
VFVTHTKEYVGQCVVRFHCPACGRRDVDGVAWHIRNVSRYLGAVQIAVANDYWIQGRCCGTKCLCLVDPETLIRLGPDEVESRTLVRRYLPLGALACVFGALLVSWIPIVGDIVAFAAWASYREERGLIWWGCRAALVFPCLHAAILICFAIAGFAGLI